MINVEVQRSETENNIAALRRFSKRVQESGVLTRARSLKHYKRQTSAHTKKRSRLALIIRQIERDRLAKLGKTPEPKKKKGGRRG